MGFPGGSDDEESACNAGDPGSFPVSGRSSTFTTPVFLPEKSHGLQRVRHDWVTNTHTHTHTHTHFYLRYFIAEHLR